MVFKAGGIASNGIKGIFEICKGISKLDSFKILKFLVGKGLTGLRTGFAKLIPVIFKFNLALLSSPITWIIAGIIALGTAIYGLIKNWDAVKKSFSTAGIWFKKCVIQPIRNLFQNLCEGIYTAFSKAWNFVKNIWGKAATWFSNHVVEPIRNVFGTIKESWKKTKERFSTDKNKEGFSTDKNKVKGTSKAFGIPGLANGGVFEANNPFLAVLGDQTRGNNIETPESLLRQIVREESHSYTPADSVSNSISNSKSNESYNYNPIFDISINGSIDNGNTERKIKEIFKKSMDEYTQSMMRRNPRLIGV